MLPKDAPGFFILGGVFCGVVAFIPTLGLALGLGEVKLIAGEGEGEIIDDAEGDFTADGGVATVSPGAVVRRGGVMDTIRGLGEDVSGAVAGDSRIGLINLGEYIEVDLPILTGPSTEPGALVGAPFCLAGREGVESDGSTRGKLCAGAEMRRDEMEGVEGMRFEEVDGGGLGIASLDLAGALRPDLTVVLPLASDDAVEDARGLVGLRRSLGLRDFRECAVEREIRVEVSDGAVDDLVGILGEVRIRD